MGLTILRQIPSGQGELLRIINAPIIVEPTDAFRVARERLLALVEAAGDLVNSIRDDDQYTEAVVLLQQLKKFKKEVETSVRPLKDQFNHGKDVLMKYVHELDEPQAKIETTLSKEMARYLIWRRQKRQEEERRLREEAERERQRKQYEIEFHTLRQEIQSAEGEAKAAERRGAKETAREIRAGLSRFAMLDAMSQAFQNPLQNVTKIRQLVALAIEHEQGRIAAAKARAEGDERLARKIEQASAKLEAPEVAPVIVEVVEAAPVVLADPELARAKGSYLKQVWKVKRIYDESQVPREFLEVSISKLNEYAKRLGTEPSIPGVQFELESKITGVRG